MAGDGELAGIVEPNEGVCGMSDSRYTRSLNQVSTTLFMGCMCFLNFVHSNKVLSGTSNLGFGTSFVAQTGACWLSYFLTFMSCGQNI